MEQDIKKALTIKPHFVIGVIVFLFATVAVAVSSSAGANDEIGVVAEEITSESDFNGIDGSLSLFAFDMIAGAWNEYNMELAAMPKVVDFDVWLNENAQTIPQTDSFHNAIHLRSEEDGFALWSGGKDHKDNTQDDYIKTYKYEQASRDL